ncbi:MAG: hydrolase [Bacteroidia bacterium]|nr:hydrolase [Bacteroidia bacterium]NNK72462.1 hydrolase [Flavobacteriaceae bacterium]
MKKNLYLYLFVFALLLVIFQFINSKNIIEKYETDITSLKEDQKTSKQTIMDLEDQNLDLLYFNLENNDDALTYFERDGYNTAELIPFLKDELYKLNEFKDDHPLVPYASMTDKPMLINKVRLLNHKWIIADFSDGEYWGEMLLNYEITDDRQLKFKVVESLLYPPQ